MPSSRRARRDEQEQAPRTEMDDRHLASSRSEERHRRQLPVGSQNPRGRGKKHVSNLGRHQADDGIEPNPVTAHDLRPKRSRFVKKTLLLKNFAIFCQVYCTSSQETTVFCVFT